MNGIVSSVRRRSQLAIGNMFSMKSIKCNCVQVIRLPCVACCFNPIESFILLNGNNIALDCEWVILTLSRVLHCIPLTIEMDQSHSGTIFILHRIPLFFFSFSIRTPSLALPSTQFNCVLACMFYFLIGWEHKVKHVGFQQYFYRVSRANRQLSLVAMGIFAISIAWHCFAASCLFSKHCTVPLEHSCVLWNHFEV